MHKFRNNFFYSCAILGIMAWTVNTILVMRICGMTHSILLREIFSLAILIYLFYSYAWKIYDDIHVSPFNGRAEVTKGDILVLRFLGPWLSLISQLIITGVLINSIHTKLFTDQRPANACEYRRGFR